MKEIFHVYHGKGKYVTLDQVSQSLIDDLHIGQNPNGDIVSTSVCGNNIILDVITPKNDLFKFYITVSWINMHKSDILCADGNPISVNGEHIVYFNRFQGFIDMVVDYKYHLTLPEDYWLWLSSPVSSHYQTEEI